MAQADKDTKTATQKEFVSEALGETFVLRRTKVSDKFTIAARQSVYLRGVDPKVVNYEAQTLSYICAALGTMLVSPPVYDFSEVVDEQAMVDVFEAWDAWNRSFRSPQPAGTASAS